MRGGGAERDMLTLATALANRCASVDLVLAHAMGEYLEAVPDSVRVIDLDSRKLVTFIADFLRYVWRERPSAILSMLLLPVMATLIAKLVYGQRLRVIVGQVSMFTDALDAATFRNRQYMNLVRLLMPKADGIVAVSEGCGGRPAWTGTPRRQQDHHHLQSCGIHSHQGASRRPVGAHLVQ